MKSKWMPAGLVLATLFVSAAQAQTPRQVQLPRLNQSNPVQSPVDLNYYNQWCDQATRILNRAAQEGSLLYGMQKYPEAKEVMETAFQRALQASNFPGTFRPYTHREIVRSLDLMQELDQMPSPSQAAHDKLITYVALNRVDFVNRVKNSLDHPYVIPCARGCGFDSERTERFESQLSELAREQLNSAQGYASRVRGNDVYPLVDGPTYFRIMARTAEWTATDLSYNLFATQFSCAIIELGNIGAEAETYARNFGDPVAVRAISNEISAISASLLSRPYGCGHYENDYNN